MKKRISKPFFDPYQNYLRSKSDIDNFEKLTLLSYGIAQQLLFKHPKEILPPLSLPKPSKDNLSMSMGDQDLIETKMTEGWLTFEEYTQKCDITLEEVEKQARSGALGQILIHPGTNKEVIIWPSDLKEKPLSDLPSPGTYRYATVVKVKAEMPINIDPIDLTNFEKIQQNYLNLAHALGKQSEIAERSEEMLYKSCLLLQWTIFEVFLKSTVGELIRKHPQSIIKNKSKKSTLSYEEIYNVTNQFTSIETLRAFLIETEIDSLQSGGSSVHGLINFLKDRFSFKSDPYKAWYIYKGEKRHSSYTELMEIKDVRNTLIHDGGKPSIGFEEKYPEVPIDREVIHIDSDYYLRARLILCSLSFNIANIIESNSYSIDY